MAVLPAWQRRRIGTRLVEAGLAACRQRGVRRVVVLGHPDYWPPDPEAKRRLQSEAKALSTGGAGLPFQSVTL
jgi:predicted N-acetyltransferase YhbS